MQNHFPYSKFKPTLLSFLNVFSKSFFVFWCLGVRASFVCLHANLINTPHFHQCWKKAQPTLPNTNKAHLKRNLTCLEQQMQPPPIVTLPRVSSLCCHHHQPTQPQHLTLYHPFFLFIFLLLTHHPWSWPNPSIIYTSHHSH